MLSLVKVLLTVLLASAAEAKVCGWGEIGPTDDYHALLTAGCSEVHLEHRPGMKGHEKQIGDLGAWKLARELVNDRSITKLTLVGQGIGPAGAAELAEMLKTNTAIVALDVIDNAIGSEGTAVLAEALKENYVLTSLLANVGDDGATAIVEARALRPTAL